MSNKREKKILRPIDPQLKPVPNKPRANMTKEEKRNYNLFWSEKTHMTS